MIEGALDEEIRSDGNLSDTTMSNTTADEFQPTMSEYQEILQEMTQSDVTDMESVDDNDLLHMEKAMNKDDQDLHAVPRSDNPILGSRRIRNMDFLNFLRSDSNAIPFPGIRSDFVGWPDPASDLLTWVCLLICRLVIVDDNLFYINFQLTLIIFTVQIRFL
ncbi:unnamed protein product [Adineta ricciae]|uniref:Uncharacterized protein n=1 Tax=Adineta ricciae TaxID=249248 RepID=A0A816DZT6_ADIRI|nr:unnamed protein product [Adineta ricciae]